ncbi:MAG: tetratricopeptide repeat protein [bacterium]
MRLTRPLAVFFAGALLATGLNVAELSAAPDQKTAQIGAAFKKARTLYRQGKYQEAIRAFDEVKDLRYHPILDYGIANCYASLRDYNKAIYYLEKYNRNYPKHKMSPKHPTVADVNEKIKSFRKLGASGGGTPAPGPGADPAHGTSDPGGTAGTPTHVTPGEGAPGGSAGDPMPGPDPYAVPPPPGGGATGGVYGTGGGGAPPPPYGVRKSHGPARRSIVLTVDLGASAFASGSQNFDSADTGGGAYLSAQWRFIPWLALGLHGGFSVVGYNSDYGSGNPFVWAVGGLEVRGYIPIKRLDIWGGLGLGYGQVSWSDSLYTYSVAGPALFVGLGLDWFITNRFSIGIVGRIYKMFPNKACVDGSCYGYDNLNPGVSWYAGLAVTWHFPVGRRR